MGPNHSSCPLRAPGRCSWGGADHTANQDKAPRGGGSTDGSEPAGLSLSSGAARCCGGEEKPPPPTFPPTGGSTTRARRGASTHRVAARPGGRRREGGGGGGGYGGGGGGGEEGGVWGPSGGADVNRAELGRSSRQRLHLGPARPLGLARSRDAAREGTPFFFFFNVLYINIYILNPPRHVSLLSVFIFIQSLYAVQ